MMPVWRNGIRIGGYKYWHCDGIAIHSGLKIRRGKPHAGWNPASATTYSHLINLCLENIVNIQNKI